MKRQNGTGSVFEIIDRRSGETRWVAALSIGSRGGRRVIKRVRRTREEAEAALVEIGAKAPLSEAERFWRYVKRGRGCWDWTGARTSRGYGLFTLDDRRKVPASRYSLELKLGRKLPSHVYALHQCDNPPCVRPDHLWPGSQSDNMLDASAKGRLNIEQGIATRSASLKERMRDHFDAHYRNPGVVTAASHLHPTRGNRTQR